MGAFFILLITFAALASHSILALEIVASSIDQQIAKGGNPDSEALNSPEKRSAGFMPMRGRKADNTFDDSKRAAFMPMRGKKYPYEFDEQQMDFNEALKRSAGFMPMRGRKSGPAYPEMYGAHGLDMAPVWGTMQDKRASAGFMPMRGKKENELMENSEEKRAAFHAVRGKKDFPSLGEGNYERSAWMEGEPSDLEKRANAFFGMRGKRSPRSARLAAGRF